MDYFLFNDVSIFDGIASNVDMYGIYTDYNYSDDGDTADSIAIYSDWCAVGKHLASSMEEADKDGQE